MAAAHFAIERARLGSEQGEHHGIGHQAKFYADNGELVWLTEIYRHRNDALNAVELLKSSALLAPIELEQADT